MVDYIVNYMAKNIVNNGDSWWIMVIGDGDSWWYAPVNWHRCGKTTPFVDHVRVLGDHPQVVTANPQWYEGDHPQLGQAKNPPLILSSSSVPWMEHVLCFDDYRYKPPFLGHFLAIFDLEDNHPRIAGDRIRPRIRSESWFSPCVYIYNNKIITIIIINNNKHMIIYIYIYMYVYIYIYYQDSILFYISIKQHIYTIAIYTYIYTLYYIYTHYTTIHIHIHGRTMGTHHSIQSLGSTTRDSASASRAKTWGPSGSMALSK